MLPSIIAFPTPDGPKTTRILSRELVEDTRLADDYPMKIGKDSPLYDVRFVGTVETGLTCSPRQNLSWGCKGNEHGLSQPRKHSSTWGSAVESETEPNDTEGIQTIQWNNSTFSIILSSSKNLIRTLSYGTRLHSTIYAYASLSWRRNLRAGLVELPETAFLWMSPCVFVHSSIIEGWGMTEKWMGVFGGAL